MIRHEIGCIYIYIYIKGQIALCTAVGQLQTKNLYTLRLWKNDSGSLFILVAVCFPRNQKHKLCSEQSEAASQYSEHYKTPNCIPTPIEGKLGWSYNRAPLWPHKKQLGSYGQSFKFCKTERTLYTSIYTLYILYKGSVYKHTIYSIAHALGGWSIYGGQLVI